MIMQVCIAIKYIGNWKFWTWKNKAKNRRPNGTRICEYTSTQMICRRNVTQKPVRGGYVGRPRKVGGSLPCRVVRTWHDVGHIWVAQIECELVSVRKKLDKMALNCLYLYVLIPGIAFGSLWLHWVLPGKFIQYFCFLTLSHKFKFYENYQSCPPCQ
jgi:hypothetical protein